MKAINRFFILFMVLMLMTLFVVLAVGMPHLIAAAADYDASYDRDAAVQDFTVESVDTVYADKSVTQEGTGDTSTGIDSRPTQDELDEAERQRQAAELEAKIQDILDQLNGAEGSGSGGSWGELPDIDDWFEGGGSLPEPSLPGLTPPELDGPEGRDPGFGDAPEFTDPDLGGSSHRPTPSFPDWSGEHTDSSPTLEECLEYLESIYGSEGSTGGSTYPEGSSSTTPSPGGDGSFELPTNVVTGLETPDPGFSGVLSVPIKNGWLGVTQNSIPLESLVVLAGSKAALEDPPSTSLPPTIPSIDITYENNSPSQQSGTMPELHLEHRDLPVEVPKVEWDDFYDDFEDWFKDQTGGWTPPDIDLDDGGFGGEGGSDFPHLHDNEDLTESWPGLERGEIPGTDIEVGVPSNWEDLYDLLLYYLAQLRANNMYGVNLTRYTVYQVESIGVSTVRTSIPRANYRWVVYDSDGNELVNRTTHENYAKLMFQGEGVYNVHVFNERDVYRNNKVSGTASEIWVLSNGGYFDGLVVYQSSHEFEAYISEDIGPTVEEIELYADGFSARVTSSMLNTICVIDENGNILMPSSGYTTQRGNRYPY